MNIKNKSNQTFKSGPNTQFNSCVGKNNPLSSSYLEGYKESVKVIYEKIIEDTHNLDTLIYPMLFCARHSIELFFKNSIIDISEINTSIDFPKLVNTHDLKNLWDTYKEYSLENFDYRFHSLVNKQEKLISDYFEIDATGQMFRYQYTKENKIHLEKFPHINIKNFYSRYQKLSELIDSVTELLENLKIEYKYGVHTDKLSREEIRQIAKELPNYKYWKEEKFNEEKEKIRQEYNLTNRKLSEAIDIIKNHYEFSSYIGIENKIRKVDVVKFANVYNYIKEYKSRTINKTELESFLKKEDKYILAIFAALIDFRKEIYYVEEFDKLVEKFYQDSYTKLIYILTTGTKIFRNLKDSLQIMNQITLLKSVEEN
ncbi:hypothetical protein CP965_10430 [Halarcobacter mediterraneus]|uniref:Uncharacterized protein n=1 Tax=Halarcobacter mediterraneus TaxID=2023153 RepID=A0A4V1M147_9BACT|nr:hypothetical protein [Halarcobacter mediterraneus]RXK12186.1 hypothetical protein CP965_10430 [Halarcobacter mediterraneus]